MNPNKKNPLTITKRHTQKSSTITSYIDYVKHSKYIAMILLNYKLELIYSTNQAKELLFVGESIKPNQMIADLKQEELTQLIRTHVLEQKKQSDKLCCFHQSGNHRWCYVEVMTVEEKEIQYVLHLQEVTELLQAESMLEIVEQIAEESYVLFDQEEKLQYMTNTARLLFYEKERDQKSVRVGSSMEEVCSTFLEGFYQKRIKETVHSGKNFSNTIQQMKHGVIKHYKVTAMPVRINKTYAGFAIIIKERIQDKSYQGNNEQDNKNEYTLANEERGNATDTQKEQEKAVPDEQRFQTMTREELYEELWFRLQLYEYMKILYLLELLMKEAKGEEKIRLEEAKEEVSNMRYEQAQDLVRKILLG